MSEIAKEALSELLFPLLYHTVRDQEAFRTRLIGFKAEVELQRKLLSENCKLLCGGQIYKFSNNHKSYVTVTSEKFSRYIPLYKKLSTAFNDLYYCQTDINDADEIQLRFYKYYREGTPFRETNIADFYKYFSIKNIEPNNWVCDKTIYNKLIVFLSHQELLELYYLRYFMACTAYRKSKIDKIIPSDFDCIVEKNGEFFIIDVKEKYKSKNNCFGLNKYSIKDYCSLIKDAPNLAFICVIKEVSDTPDRELIDWRYISFAEFIERSNDSKNVLGGIGQFPKQEDAYTRLVPIEHFKHFRIEDL